MGEWVEINSEKDLPNEDLFCWWVNRKNGYVFVDKLKGQLGRSLTHLTFSHYMIIEEPEPPKNRKQLEEATSWTTFNVNDILKEKLKNKQ